MLYKLSAMLLLGFLATNVEAVGGTIVVTKPPSNCFNNNICLKFDTKRNCVYWAKDKKGNFIKCRSKTERDRRIK